MVVDLSWPTVTFFAMGTVTLPVYILVLVTIISKRNQNRYKTTFYNLIISLGIADVTTMVNFFVFSSLRTICAFPEFFWENSGIFSVWGFNQMYYFLCLRSLGAVLLAFQRYLCICKPGSKLSLWFERLPRYQVFLIHWISPIFIVFPILINSEKSFDTLLTLELVVAPHQIKLANLIANIFLFITFAMLCFAYASILRKVIKTKVTRNLRREVRLTLITIGPLLSFFCAFCYYTFQMFFSMTGNSKMIFTMRIYFPLVTGFMSYVNGWVFFLFNVDLRRELLKPFRRGVAVTTISENT